MLQSLYCLRENGIHMSLGDIKHRQLWNFRDLRIYVSKGTRGSDLVLKQCLPREGEREDQLTLSGDSFRQFVELDDVRDVNNESRPLG